MLVSEFLTNLKRRGQYQAAQTVLTDADLIAFANDEMRMVICPKILSLRDNYFRGQKDYALSSNRRYRLPSRILGSRIAQVTVVNGSQQYDLPQLSSTAKPTNYDTGFYVTQGDIVIVGTIPTGTLRIFYPIRPPKMSSTAIPIGTVISVGSTSVTLNNVVTPCQIIRGGSPFRTITPNMTVALGVGTDTDSGSDYDRFQVGDLMINPDATHIVPLEEQLTDWLLQRTHMRVLEALGQTDELQAAGSKLADIERDAMALMSPRVENAPKTIFGGQILGWRE